MDSTSSTHLHLQCLQQCIITISILFALSLLRTWRSERDIKALKAENHVMKKDLAASDELVEELEYDLEVAELRTQIGATMLRINQENLIELQEHCWDLSETLAEYEMDAEEEGYEAGDEDEDEDEEESNETWGESDEDSEQDWIDIDELDPPPSPPTSSDHATAYLKAVIQTHLLFGKPLPGGGSREQFRALFDTDFKLLSLWLACYNALEESFREEATFYLKGRILCHLFFATPLPGSGPREQFRELFYMDSELLGLWLECFETFKDEISRYAISAEE
ncbi:MAG: hypothetical protein Q9195_002342 [Heterodermia aff. obscurata]